MPCSIRRRCPKVRPGFVFDNDLYRVQVLFETYRTFKGMRIACSNRKRGLMKQGFRFRKRKVPDGQYFAKTLILPYKRDGEKWIGAEIFFSTAQGEWPFAGDVAHECQHVAHHFVLHGDKHKMIRRGVGNLDEARAHMTGAFTQLILEYCMTGSMPKTVPTVFASVWKGPK